MVSLSACKLFDGLSATELNTLRGLCRVESYPAGHVLFREGEAGEAVYVVRSGLVEITTAVSGGKAQIISRFGPGDFFGEMAVIEFKPRSATATATEPTVAYRIPAGEMMTLVHRTPDIAVNMMREMSRRLRDFNVRHVQEISQAERLALVGRFTRSILHDIRNPLGIIGLAADTAAREGASAEFRKSAAERIRRQVDRITGLVGEVLAFTQGSGGAVLSPVPYAAFVRETVGEMIAELESKGVAVQFENDPPSVPVLLDPPRMQRVFRSLLRNALEAMPLGGVVSLRFTLKEKRIITEIEDTGPGIAPEIIRNLFEPFASHGKGDSPGLGLSIARRIIEDHHGRIWADHKRGHGAIFIFSIPRPE